MGRPNNLYNRKSDKSTRYYSTTQEKAVAKVLGGNRVANSGATKFSKGDVRLDNFLIECKTCVSPQKSFTLKKEWFDKNEEETFAMNKDYSALSFSFGDGVNYYVIDERLFKLLVNLLDKEIENGN